MKTSVHIRPKRPLRTRSLIGLAVLLLVMQPGSGLSTPPQALPPSSGMKPAWSDPDGGRVIISPDGRLVATQFWDFMRVLDVKTGAEVRRIEHGLRDIVYRFTPDSTQLIIADEANGSATIWDIETGRKAFTSKRQYRGGRGHRELCLSRDGHLLAIAEERPWRRTLFGARPAGRADVRVFEIRSGKQIARFVEDDDYIYGFDFTSDGKYLLTKTQSDPAKLWDMGSGRVVRTFLMSDLFDFSPDGRFIAFSGTKFIRVLSVSTGEIVSDLKLPIGDPEGGPADAVAYSPDGKQFAASELGLIAVYDVTSGAVTAMLGERYTEKVRRFVGSIALTPDGSILIAGGTGGLRMWNLKDNPVPARVHVTNQ